MWVHVKQVISLGGAIIDHRAIISTVLVEVDKMKLHAKYQKHGLSSFRQDFFLFKFCLHESMYNIKTTSQRGNRGNIFFNNLSLISLMEQFCQIKLKLVVVSDK